MKNLVLLLGVLLFFTGCGDEKGIASNKQKKREMPPLPVTSEEVRYEKVGFAKKYPAVLKPFQEVDITARVSGILQKRNFVEGTFVHKGDILYEIEKEEYKAILDEAKAALSKARANLNKTSKDWRRALYLFENRAISEQQRDERLHAYEDAKAQIRQAKASLASAKLDYGYTTIKSPLSGIAGISSSDVGNYIDAEKQNAVLTTVTVQDPVYIEFSIPSEDVALHASQIQIGATVALQAGAKKFEAKLDYIAPKMDLETDSLLLRSIVKNPKKELIIGSYVQVYLDGFSFAKVAKIPQNALVQTADATMVFVIEEGIAKMRPVHVVRVANGVALIDKGVREKERIVTSNIAKVRPNAKVTIKGGS